VIEQRLPGVRRERVGAGGPHVARHQLGDLDVGLPRAALVRGQAGQRADLRAQDIAVAHEPDEAALVVHHRQVPEVLEPHDVLGERQRLLGEQRDHG
jgi:hypothetical protein